MSGRAPIPPRRTKASRIPKLTVQSFDYSAEDPLHAFARAHNDAPPSLRLSPEAKSASVVHGEQESENREEEEDLDESVVLGSGNEEEVVVHQPIKGGKGRLGVAGAQRRARKERDADLPVFGEPMDLQVSLRWIKKIRRLFF